MNCLHSWHYMGKRCYRCRKCGEHKILPELPKVPEYLKQCDPPKEKT